ncbi:MAG TPA: long-chain fatty acid--CoA ligase [Syntrophomonadaceae bacterium]|nr:long-chain fatty acid--CoA ligase [Syntrophomonadaceae bacterium]HPR93332.1 long-chain fatty acid--CoA ligase [Syntrophomonadaceae bacterium]
MDRVWYKFYDKGVPYSIDYPGKPLKNYFNEWVAKNPDKPYLIWANKDLTYAEANALAQKTANAIIKLGYQKGDRIALMSTNLFEYVILLQACYKIGAAIVPTNPMYTIPELTHQFADSQSTIIFAEDRFAAKIVEIMKSGKTIIKNLIILDSHTEAPEIKGENIMSFPELLLTGAAVEPDIEVKSEDLAMLQYTGGTTGLSKGCMLSNSNLEAMAWQDTVWFSPPFEKSEDMRIMCAMPLYHIYGFNTSVNINMIAGGNIIIVNGPTPDNMLKNINEHEPNFFAAVPAMIYGLNNHPDIGNSKIRHIKAMICGSSPLAVEGLNRFEQLSGAAITEGYGLSETSNVLTCTPMFTKRKIGSVGIPWPDVDIRIVDLQTGTVDMPVGEPGELIAQGPQIMSAYWKNPGETDNVLRDGWLYTGDIATMDEDGFFTIVDRKKDMILCSGFNVFCREIDEVLYTHPKVLDACAIGIPDPKRGETPKIFVILKPGETMTEEEVKEHCRKSLAPYKVPTHVEFINELPRTSVGKPMRNALRQQELAKNK